MARRNQGINVKIPRVKVIKALEQALIKLETNYKNQEVNQAEYEAAKERWNKEASKLLIARISEAIDLKITTRYNGKINIDFDLPGNIMKLPEEPIKDYIVMHEWQYRESKEEIENAIRVLNMCDDELISTATYGGISKYL